MNILIVEDEPGISKSIVQSIRRLRDGCVPLIADTIGKAESFLAVTPSFDLIFFDAKLGTELTTNGLIEKAKTKFPQCIMVATSSDPEQFKLQKQQGCTHELKKPDGIYGQIEALLNQVPN